MKFRVDQVGVVVRDLDRAREACTRFFGEESLPPIEFETGGARLRLAFFQAGEVQLELIQVVEGETIHSKFLREKGEGLHHLGYFVEDLERSLSMLEKEGVKVLWRGEVPGAAKFAYLDTEKTLGITLELVQLG
ncbi:MAG: VOC family protein [Candidatus Hadarchaeales archaeon]